MFILEQARYNTYGELNAAKDNLLIVCHALTGNSRLDQWWGTMLGESIQANLSPKLLIVLLLQ
jgi:homoserine acetyltransferase